MGSDNISSQSSPTTGAGEPSVLCKADQLQWVSDVSLLIVTGYGVFWSRRTARDPQTELTELRRHRIEIDLPSTTHNQLCPGEGHFPVETSRPGMTSFSLRFFIFLLDLAGSNVFGVEFCKSLPHARA
jgi:hypothetical protein